VEGGRRSGFLPSFTGPNAKDDAVALVAEPDDIEDFQIILGNGHKESTSGVLGSQSSSNDIALAFKELGVQPSKHQMDTAYKWKMQWIHKVVSS